MKHCCLGRILYHIDGAYGFDTSFKSKKEAQHYKKMFEYIIKNDRYKVNTELGVYDTDSMNIKEVK